MTGSGNSSDHISRLNSPDDENAFLEKSGALKPTALTAPADLSIERRDNKAARIVICAEVKTFCVMLNLPYSDQRNAGRDERLPWTYSARFMFRFCDCAAPIMHYRAEK
jgi:hypothetical protein